MKDAKGHGSNGRGGKRLAKPIPGHPYHSKSDAELRFIAKDAAEAREAMRGHSPDAENKYADQVNDAASVLGYRDRGGQQDRAAADALHSGGAKSDAAPTHDGMSGIERSESVLRGMNEAAMRAGITPRQGFGNTRIQSPLYNNGNGYNAGAVDKAIASSNRAGRRIGGKEASAIHRLLKGRH